MSLLQPTQPLFGNSTRRIDSTLEPHPPPRTANQSGGTITYFDQNFRWARQIASERDGDDSCINNVDGLDANAADNNVGHFDDFDGFDDHDVSRKVYKNNHADSPDPPATRHREFAPIPSQLASPSWPTYLATPPTGRETPPGHDSAGSSCVGGSSAPATPRDCFTVHPLRVYVGHDTKSEQEGDGHVGGVIGVEGRREGHRGHDASNDDHSVGASGDDDDGGGYFGFKSWQYSSFRDGLLDSDDEQDEDPDMTGASTAMTTPEPANSMLASPTVTVATVPPLPEAVPEVVPIPTMETMPTTPVMPTTLASSPVPTAFPRIPPMSTAMPQVPPMSTAMPRVPPMSTAMPRVPPMATAMAPVPPMSMTMPLVPHMYMAMLRSMLPPMPPMPTKQAGFRASQVEFDTPALRLILKHMNLECQTVNDQLRDDPLCMDDHFFYSDDNSSISPGPVMPVRPGQPFDTRYGRPDLSWIDPGRQYVYFSTIWPSSDDHMSGFTRLMVSEVRLVLEADPVDSIEFGPIKRLCQVDTSTVSIESVAFVLLDVSVSWDRLKHVYDRLLDQLKSLVASFPSSLVDLDHNQFDLALNIKFRLGMLERLKVKYSVLQNRMLWHVVNNGIPVLSPAQKSIIHPPPPAPVRAPYHAAAQWAPRGATVPQWPTTAAPQWPTTAAHPQRASPLPPYPAPASAPPPRPPQQQAPPRPCQALKPTAFPFFPANHSSSQPGWHGQAPPPPPGLHHRSDGQSRW